MSDWKVRVLRFTLFPASPPKPDEVMKWEEVTGEPPDASQSQVKLGRLQETGAFKKGQLVLAVTPGRIDWRYEALAPEIGPDDLLTEIPNAGLLKPSLEWFRPLMLKWLQSAPTASRLAFGAELVLPADSSEEAYTNLDALLPAVGVDPKSSDFAYTINRRRPSKSIAGLEINRLSKWNALRILWGALDKTNTPVTSGPTLYATRVEIDVNTRQDYDEPITTEVSPTLFNELVELAVEIAENGDIP